MRARVIGMTRAIILALALPILMACGPDPVSDCGGMCEPFGGRSGVSAHHQAATGPRDPRVKQGVTRLRCVGWTESAIVDVAETRLPGVPDLVVKSSS